MSAGPAVQLGGVARDTDFETAMQDAADAEAAIAEAVANVENKDVERGAKVAALQSKIALVITCPICEKSHVARRFRPRAQAE